MLRKRALFLHIQKTAGTSVQEMARQIYGNSQVSSHGDFVKLGLEKSRQHDFVSGHFGYAFAQPLMSGRYCFTFLRDPVDRITSLYRFCRSREPTEQPLYAIAHKTDLEGFLSDDHGPDHLSKIWNNQVWQLAIGYGHSQVGLPLAHPLTEDPLTLINSAKRNLATFNHIGFVSTFNEDIAEIFKALGAPNVEVKKSNVSIDHSGGALSSSLRRRLAEITELDRELYDHAIRTYRNPAIRRRWIRDGFARVTRKFRRK
ncbi:sulfotransferase family 2 domain-containing protein [Tabrizicola sp. BL-A-41-H6]|uniref:sulfotransferase family 2 domain-containing protein n=1 Tax=Tabrizicola sp. BL-A-41-H6 TaxID=3421107 RepID=UPI003D669D34